MSDIKGVVRDTKRGGCDMSDPAVIEAKDWLFALTKLELRGPTDTMTAARDRKARKLKIEPSYAKRIWQRWDTMSDVSGKAYRALRNAYELECARMDAIADHYDARTKELLHATDLEDGASSMEGSRLLDRQPVSQTATALRRAGR